MLLWSESVHRAGDADSGDDPAVLVSDWCSDTRKSRRRLFVLEGQSRFSNRFELIVERRRNHDGPRAGARTSLRSDPGSFTSTCPCTGRPGRGAPGILAREGTLERPSLTEIFVVNDYAMSWLAAMAVMATLQRRAIEGGSYRIHLSLARLSIWMMQMGLFEKGYALDVGSTTGITPTCRQSSSTQTPLAALTRE